MTEANVTLITSVVGAFPPFAGGEFIINGSERCIVNQLHRSPGVDFSIQDDTGDRQLHKARIIPERGSWIEIEVTKKDVLAMKIDQSAKIAATTFLRALDEDFSSTEKILDKFYDVQEMSVNKLKPEYYSAELIIDSETGEELWSFQTGSGIFGSPSTYTINGKQFVAVPSGFGGWTGWAHFGEGGAPWLKDSRKGGIIIGFGLQ